MNLQTKIDERLWGAIRSTYEARNFSAAILDAIHFLSELIRERSGLEGDGVNLVGRAFGGKAPVLKVNNLNTESEKNVQAGIEQLLRGIYQAVRNPRSHGSHQDSEDDAIAIILFLNHLLGAIDRAKTPFSQQLFVKRVLDPDFVPKERYAQLLIEELPATKRLDIFHDVFGKLQDGDGNKLKFFFEALLGKMTEEEKGIICGTLSDVLRDADDTSIIRKIIQAFPNEIWPSIAEVSRLRVEHMLIESVKDGKYHAGQGKCRGGSFGTWATNIAQHFSMKNELYRILINKLHSADKTEQDYVFTYLSGVFTDLYKKPPRGLIDTVNKGLTSGDIRFKKMVESYFFWGEGDWTKPFQENIDNFEEAEMAFDPNDDDIPF